MTSRNRGRHAFIAELVLLALPLSIVDAVAVVATVFDVLSPPKNYPAWANVGMAMLLALATASLVSGWTLSVRFLRGGARSLVDSHWLFWFFCALGGLIAAAALASLAFPMDAWSESWHFRNDSKPLISGLLLLIPFTHLLVARFRHGR